MTAAAETGGVREGPLQGRVILVTGAAHGGTHDLVRGLATAGARLALCATFEMRARVKLATRPGGAAMAVAIRWNDEESICGGIQRITTELGPIEGIVHIAPEDRGLTPTSDRVAGQAMAAGGLRDGIVVYYQESAGALEDLSHNLPYEVAAVPVAFGDRRALVRAASLAVAACERHFQTPAVLGKIPS